MLQKLYASYSMQDKAEDGTASGLTDLSFNTSWGQSTMPLMASTDSERRNSTLVSPHELSTPAPAFGESQDATKSTSDAQTHEEGLDSEAPTYKGIYLPMLTNRFNDKKLEAAYQRYACRQVRL